MYSSRRRFLTLASQLGVAALGAASGLWTRIAAAADPRAAFEATDLKQALANIGVTEMKDSTDIALKTPDIAENGAVVPVEVSSTLPLSLIHI